MLRLRKEEGRRNCCVGEGRVCRRKKKAVCVSVCVVTRKGRMAGRKGVSVAVREWTMGLSQNEDVYVE